MPPIARPSRSRVPAPALAALAALHVVLLVLVAGPARGQDDDGGGPEPGQGGTGGGPRSEVTVDGNQWLVPVALGAAVLLGIALIAFFVHNRARKRPADHRDRGARSGEGQHR